MEVVFSGTDFPFTVSHSWIAPANGVAAMLTHYLAQRRTRTEDDNAWRDWAEDRVVTGLSTGYTIGTPLNAGRLLQTRVLAVGPSGSSAYVINTVTIPTP